MSRATSRGHVVISGGSIAGLSAAYWLRRTGWDVTVIERAAGFREGGQNVDVRGVGREVLQRMGLFDAVLAQNTTETQTVFVDEHGDVTVELPSDGPDGATAELEVLRGDFAKAIHDGLPEGVEFVYDDVITDLDEGASDVVVSTEAGRRFEADLVVIAEGVRSRTRDRLFADSVDPRELGITMAFGTIARTETDDDRWRWYTTTGGRQVHLRPDNHGTTRAILAFASDTDVSDLDRPALMADLRKRYADAGWESARVLDGFADSDDLYVDFLTQIRMPSWHRGRVCLSGDAAWCVTPMGGGGSTLALTSGYVLAAYLADPDVAQGSDGIEPAGIESAGIESARIESALGHWEDWMRPLVEDIQKLPSGVQNIAYPKTRLGLKLRDLAAKAFTATPLSEVAAKVTQIGETEQELPALVS